MRDDPPQNGRRGRHLLHLYRRESHIVQPLLHGRQGVRHRKEGEHQDAAAHAVEEGHRASHPRRGGRTLECRRALHRAHQVQRQYRAVVQHVLRVRKDGLPCCLGGEAGAGEGFRHRGISQRPRTLLSRRGVRLPAEQRQAVRPVAEAVHRLRDRRHQRPPDSLSRNDDYHHGVVHQQDAPSERHPQDDTYRGGVESDRFGEHGLLHQVPLQDRPQVLRRGRRSDAGGGRHHLVADRQGEHHQQLRL